MDTCVLLNIELGVGVTETSQFSPKETIVAMGIVHFRDVIGDAFL